MDNTNGSSFSLSSSGSFQSLSSGNPPFVGRWKVPNPPSSQQQANGSRKMILLEKKMRSNDLAVKEINQELVQETLALLRKKANDLQKDKWMYEDIHL